MARTFLVGLCFVIVGCVRGITVEERLNELERILILQTETLSQHESLIREQREKLETVQNENIILKNRVEVLENAIEQLQIIPTYKVDEIGTPEAEDDQQPVSGDIHRIINDSDDSGVRQDRSQRRQVFNSPYSENVAFYAHSLAANTCLHDHEVLVFAMEETDEGNGYNKDDGIYVVPMTGTYVFTWATTSRHNWYESEIMVNGHARGVIMANDSSNSDMAHATGLIVTNVVAGDHVYIRRSHGSGCNVNSYDVKFATFSGWLLFATE